MPAVPPEPPSGLPLPATEVASPKSLWRFLVVRLAVVATIALLMDFFLARTNRDFVEAAIFLALVGLVAMLQVPLLERRWRRLDRERRDRLGPETIFAGAARAEVSDSAKPVPGELVLNRAGMSFTPRKPTEQGGFSAAWSDIARVSLRPAAAAPLAGSLEITFSGGPPRTFLVQRCGPLAEVLSELGERT